MILSILIISTFFYGQENKEGVPAGFKGVRNNVLLVQRAVPIMIQFERAKIANCTIASGSSLKYTNDGATLNVVVGADASMFVKLVDETVYPLSFKITNNSNISTQLYKVTDEGDIEASSDNQSPYNEESTEGLTILDTEALELVYSMYNFQGKGKYRIEELTTPAGKIAGMEVFNIAMYTSEHYTGNVYRINNTGGPLELTDNDIVLFTNSVGLPVIHLSDAYHIDGNSRTRLIVLFRR